MSTNTILASAPLTSTGYHLKANGTTLGNSLIWDNGTNVGIGNTNTSYTLDVSGTGRFTSTLLVSGAATFSSTLGCNGAFIQPNQMEIFSSAGASNRAYAFSVGNIAAGDFTISQGSSATGGTYTPRLVITSGGNVGIGDSGAATVRFQIKSGGSTSASYAIITRDSANADLLVIRDDGYGYLKAAAWAYGSDRRIKKNISYIETGIDKVMALKPATFDYIDGVKNNIGWIAQDVQEIIPEAVGTISETNDQLTLKSDFIVPFLVKAIQEQQIQIQNLQEQINILAK